MISKLTRLLTFLALLPVCTQPISAQAQQCQYTIIMNDTYGDGWNDGILTVVSGSQSTSFTLIDGLTDTQTFNVSEGQPLTFTWVEGTFLYEVSYQILNNLGQVIAQATAPAMPGSGVLYSGVGECTFCTKPLNANVDEVWDTYAKLQWTSDPISPNPAEQWRVIYILRDSLVNTGQGDTAFTAIPKVTLTGLQKKTWYDAYIDQYCGTAGGWSDRVGPIPFQTYWTKDMGIAGIVSPVSDCDLGYDTVRVLMKNYGSAPQGLIRFRYSVNGEEVNIPKPDDGVYTGVIGKDGVESVAFETMYDFSEPGEYVIRAYTKLAGDQDLSNDTFTYYLNNRLFSPYQQPFEVWDGGWKVTTTGAALPTFEYGTPAKDNIPGAGSGQFSWVTDLSDPYNANERSYLESPCFDFMQLSVDPVITFSIAHDLESAFDSAWLEVSVDGGSVWKKVGGINEGINWYNLDANPNLPQVGEAWSGNSGGWVTARHFLTGAAGKSEVHVRFAFASNGSQQLDGLGIDNVRIFPAFNNDLAGTLVDIASENDLCGREDEPVTFSFVNVGAHIQNGFQVAYSVNGSTPVVENVVGAIAPDQPRSYTFTAKFDSRDALSVIKCWTILSGEFAPGNDTATYTIDHRPLPAPFHEDFEDQVIPQDWTTDGVTSNTHGNTSWVLAVNLNASNTESIHALPRYGLISANDSIEFSYRIVNVTGGGPTLLSLGTKFELQVSTDCGANYQTLNTINNLNHSPTTVLQTRKIGLAQFAGQAIAIRFRSTRSAGDFWFDIDNINLLSCAADMALTATITNAAPGQSNGAATVNVGLGNPPFTYAWSTGETSQTVNNLETGAYSVTVNDAFGCSDAFEFFIGTSAVSQIKAWSTITLQPNPTTGIATFTATFDRMVGDARLQVVNLLGQSVWESKTANTTLFSEKIDLAKLPDGLYLIRLMADGQVVTKKLVKE